MHCTFQILTHIAKALLLKFQRSLWAVPLRHSRIKNGNGACKFSFSAEMEQKVNLQPMEFVYRAPVVGNVDANLAILSSDLHSGDKLCTDILSLVFLTIDWISLSLSEIHKHAAATKKTEVSS